MCSACAGDATKTSMAATVISAMMRLTISHLLSRRSVRTSKGNRMITISIRQIPVRPSEGAWDLRHSPVWPTTHPYSAECLEGVFSEVRGREEGSWPLEWAGGYGD